MKNDITLDEIVGLEFPRPAYCTMSYKRFEHCREAYNWLVDNDAIDSTSLADFCRTCNYNKNKKGYKPIK